MIGRPPNPPARMAAGVTDRRRGLTGGTSRRLEPRIEELRGIAHKIAGLLLWNTNVIGEVYALLANRGHAYFPLFREDGASRCFNLSIRFRT